jgi:hypothetical protein
VRSSFACLLAGLRVLTRWRRLVGVALVAAGADWIPTLRCRTGRLGRIVAMCVVLALTATAPAIAYQTDSGISFSGCPVASLGTGAADVRFLTGASEGFNGLAGDDVIYGYGGNDCLFGNLGNDTTYGGDGNDAVAGEPGKDALYGDAGNDEIDALEYPTVAATGTDSVLAGSGDDDVKADDGVADTIDCGSGQDRVDADLGDTLIFCEQRVELIGRDTLAPTLHVSGRLRELENKLLFGQLYPLTVIATEPPGASGLRRIDILVDGVPTASRSDGCASEGCSRSLSWNFDPRIESLAIGAHSITARAEDHAGNQASVTWTVQKSRYADMTEQEILEDSIEFRTDFGLNTDAAYIDQIMHDPALESNWEFYGVPLTTAELAAVDALNSDSSEPWGQLVADDPAAPLRQSRPAPSRRDPIERYGSDEAADAYAGKYIAHGQIRVGFTRDAASHVARLRQQTGKPLVPFKARYSLRYLQELHKQIVDDWRELESSGIDVTRVGVDIPDNVVRVGTKAPLTDAQRQHLLDRYGPAIRLITSDGLQLLADRWDRHNRP